MIVRELKKAFRYIRSLPKSVYFNFRYLEFRQAILFPVWISHRVSLDRMKGKILVDDPSPGMVQIGFDRTGVYDESMKSVWHVDGIVHFRGRARISPGARFMVGGRIEFGDNFNTGAGASFFCSREIVFGRNNLLSWNVVIMDHDFHEIRNLAGERLNEPEPVLFGDNVWIGFNVSALKGSGSDDDCVIAAGTLLNRKVSGKNQIIGGSPPKTLKAGISWIY